MRVPVLKALANPARIFYVPYDLAVVNFMLQFLLFVVTFTIGLTLTGGRLAINPLYFMISAMIVHSMLAVWSKKEPFILQIVRARLALFRKKMPRRMVP